MVSTETKCGRFFRKFSDRAFFLDDEFEGKVLVRTAMGPKVLNPSVYPKVWFRFKWTMILEKVHLQSSRLLISVASTRMMITSSGQTCPAKSFSATSAIKTLLLSRNPTIKLTYRKFCQLSGSVLILNPKYMLKAEKQIKFRNKNNRINYCLIIRNLNFVQGLASTTKQIKLIIH